jgi:hypothetical protein
MSLRASYSVNSVVLESDDEFDDVNDQLASRGIDRASKIHKILTWTRLRLEMFSGFDSLSNQDSTFHLYR